MRFGIHMPMKGGFNKNAHRLKEIGCQCLQIFPGNPTSWRLPGITLEEIKQRAEYLEKLELFPLVIHSVYLVNLASPKNEVYEKSEEMIRETMKRAHIYGAPYVVVHTGSHGSSGREKGIARVIKALEKQIPSWPQGVTLLLENTSGGGSLLGGSFSDLGEIIGQLYQAPLGVCLDTAHAWGAGYDLSNSYGVRQTLDDLFEQVDHCRLKLIHANDSDVKMGSGKDRHQHIGKGKIGEEGFVALLQNQRNENVPVVLETPEIGTDKDRENLDMLKKYAQAIH